MASKEYSIVEYYAEHEGYRCGYCKSSDSNYSHGMWAHSLTVDDYQDLIDRGWRRSGRYCYKPTMHVTCCPMYTIKCNALDFRLSKSQKKVLKRVNRFLGYGDTKSNDGRNSVGSSSQASECEGGSGESGFSDIPELHPKLMGTEKSMANATISSMDPSLLGKIELPKKIDVLTNLGACSDTASQHSDDSERSKIADGKKLCRPGLGRDGSLPPSKKAKLIRMERKHQKLLKQGLSVEEASSALKQSKSQAPQTKSLNDFFNESLPETPAHRLEVRLVQSCPPSREFQAAAQEEFQVYRKYQMAVHGDAADKCTQRQYTRFLVNSPLQTSVVAVGSVEFSRSLPESRALYAKYQIAVHREKPEECNTETFYEFLVNSPLEARQERGGPPQGYGSFHQQYWLDGRLVAVGVIDILPSCVSSVYFYYDPDLGHLSLGTYASLREIFLAQTLHQSAPNLQYYYMGFYIHSCPKMRYKASYNPSFLLCPETYTWHPIIPCQIKLDRSKYCRLEESQAVTDSSAEINLNEVLVLSHQRAMPYHVYKVMDRNANDAQEVAQYAMLVGMKCARRMLLVRT